METQRPQSIADLARLAGVSKATVSRALNDSPLIGAETKERVRAIAREHRFQLNVPARRLSLRQSHAVGLVTYEPAPDPAVPDTFMLEIMSGISRGLRASDYDLLVVHVDPGEPEWARRYLESGRVDGFVVLSATCSQQDLEALVALEAPLIVWGSAPAGHAYCSVVGDNVAGGRLATEHLLRSARGRIGLLGGPARHPEVRDRRRGYEAALRDAGIAVEPELVAHVPWEPAATDAAMRRLLAAAPDLDAVVCNSDLLAIAAMDTIRACGRSVPHDVAVVGYDDISAARHSNPPLTTIRQNGVLAGTLLAENLVRHLQTGVVTDVTIPAELVVRESA